MVADLLDGLDQIERAFDFAYDWELLHHVFPEQRAGYLETVHGLLRPGARYLSVSFSDQDPWLEGGKYRKTPLGTLLYFSGQSKCLLNSPCRVDASMEHGDIIFFIVENEWLMPQPVEQLF